MPITKCCGLKTFPESSSDAVTDSILAQEPGITFHFWCPLLEYKPIFHIVLQVKGEPETLAQHHLLPCIKKDNISEVAGEVLISM